MDDAAGTDADVIEPLLLRRKAVSWQPGST
jgi:hypothetical protein